MIATVGTAPLAGEDLVPVNQAAGLFPVRPAPATLWRWILRGSRGVRLETLMIGGRRFTSRAAVARFIEGVTRAATPALAATPSTTARQRHAAAEREAAALGI